MIHTSLPDIFNIKNSVSHLKQFAFDIYYLS